MTSIFLGIHDTALDQEARSLLRELPEFTVVGSATNPAEVLRAAVDIDPEVVVLAAPNGGAVAVVNLARELGRVLPHVAVVLAVRDAGPTAFAEALRVGARGLVTVPLKLEDLRARLGEAAEWSLGVRRALGLNNGYPQTGPAGRTVAVAGAKGGVGATTVAVRLALSCAEANLRVCLVDFDLQTGDVGTLLNISHRRSVADLAGVGEVTVRMVEEAAFPHQSGLHVLLSPPEGERSEDITTAVARQVLAAVRSRFDIIIFDVGSQTSEASAAAVEMADEVLLVSTLDLLAVQGARRLARLWVRVHARKEEDVRVVFSRVSRNSQVQPEVARRVVRLPSARTVLPAAFRALETSVNEADPARLEDKTLRRAFDALASEIGVLRGTTRPAAAGHARRRRPRPDDGQAALEFVGVLPLILLVGLLLWQFVLLGYTWVLAGNAADDAGRRLEVHDTDVGVRAGALAEVPSGWHEGAQVRIDRVRSSVAVTLHTPVLVPGFVDLPLSFTSRAVVPAEPP